MTMTMTMTMIMTMTMTMTMTLYSDGCGKGCNDQGECKDGKCVCNQGFEGEFCTLSKSNYILKYFYHHVLNKKK